MSKSIKFTATAFGQNCFYQFNLNQLIMGMLHMIMLTRVLQTSVEKYNVRWLDTIKVHNV